MSKIKRWSVRHFDMNGDVAEGVAICTEKGRYLKADNIIPGTNITVLEGVEKVREMVAVLTAECEYECTHCHDKSLCPTSKALTLPDGRMISLVEKDS